MTYYLDVLVFLPPFDKLIFAHKSGFMYELWIN